MLGTPIDGFRKALAKACKKKEEKELYNEYATQYFFQGHGVSYKEFRDRQLQLIEHEIAWLKKCMEGLEDKNDINRQKNI